MRMSGQISFRCCRHYPAGRLYAAALASLAVFVIVRLLLMVPPAAPQKAEARAERQMETALRFISFHCRQQGMEPEAEDINRTFLIGPEISPLTTTPGHLDAKRTTLNPQLAGLIVRLLQQAGTGPGDRVAISASGSFPGLMIASVCAVQALQAEPVTMLSAGSSSFGASRPRFSLIDIYEVLHEKGLFEQPAAAYSLGGSRDTGGEFPEHIQTALISRFKTDSVPFIYEPDLNKNTALRMALYRADSLSAFINCGGSRASLGISSRVLAVKPGLNLTVDLPPAEQRGVLFAMAARGLPVIHLLFIRGLAETYNLPWDPVPLPEAGRAGLRRIPPRHRLPFSIIFAIYVFLLAALLVPGGIRTCLPRAFRAASLRRK